MLRTRIYMQLMTYGSICYLDLAVCSTIVPSGLVSKAVCQHSICGVCALQTSHMQAVKPPGQLAPSTSLGHVCVVVCCCLQGDEYLTKERARLERMISSGGVAANKVDDFARKSSVLSAFAADEVAEE